MGAEFLLVVVPNATQTHPDPEYRRRFQEGLGVENLSRPEERVEAMAERAGYEVLSLGEPFQRLAERDQVYLHGFTGNDSEPPGTGHWNSRGHELAGRLAASAIADRILDSP